MIMGYKDLNGNATKFINTGNENLYEAGKIWFPICGIFRQLN